MGGKWQGSAHGAVRRCGIWAGGWQASEEGGRAGVRLRMKASEDVAGVVPGCAKRAMS